MAEVVKSRTILRRFWIRSAVAATLVLVSSPIVLLPRIRGRLWRDFLWVWVKQTTVSYGPDPNQQIDFLSPRMGSRNLRPVVAVFHGGGWRTGTRSGIVQRVCRRYLEKGFLVANIEYRRGGVGPASADAVRALYWISTKARSFGGDEDRLVVTGESAGGHLALYASLTAGVPVRAVINFYGVTNISEFPQIASDRSLASAPSGTMERLSPLAIVRPGIASVLSIHATRDPLVGVSHTTRLTKRLRDAGVAAAEILIDWDQHGFEESQLNQIYPKVFRFLETVL